MKYLIEIRKKSFFTNNPKEFITNKLKKYTILQIKDYGKVMAVVTQERTFICTITELKEISVERVRKQLVKVLLENHSYDFQSYCEYHSYHDKQKHNDIHQKYRQLIVNTMTRGPKYLATLFCKYSNDTFVSHGDKIFYFKRE